MEQIPDATKPASEVPRSEAIAPRELPLEHGRVEAWAGPLPPPSILAEYERTHPGLAERIISAFESQISHRHRLETKAVEIDIEKTQLDSKERRRGQYLAFVLCLATIVCGTLAALHGAQLAGSIIGCTGLAGLATAFIYAHRDSSLHR